MFDNTFANAVVLTLANGGQVAKTLIRCLVKLLQLLQRLLSDRSQLTLLGSLSQRIQHALVYIVSNEPT